MSEAQAIANADAVDSAVLSPELAAPAAKGEVLTMSTTYPSMEAFRKEQPKLYEAMTSGISQTIIMQSRRRTQRLIEMMKESRRNNP